MASSAIERGVKSTILIRNQWGGSGTGFLVFRRVGEEVENYGKLFVVTNKHVIHEQEALRHSASGVRLGVNMKRGERLVGELLDCTFQSVEGRPLWREHPEPDVDVFAFDVSWLVLGLGNVDYLAQPYERFADREIIREHQIVAGDEIFVTGYPLGIRQGRTNHPLVRRGIVASRIGEELQEDIRDATGNMVGTRNMRGFFVDGATVPGSSGSPVFLYPGMGRVVGQDVVGTPAFLLGIIAETRHAPIATAAGVYPSFAGLGLAFDAETIRETIELFSFE